MIFLESIDSTHRYLKQYIKNNSYINPMAIITTHQTNGIGSRNNSWNSTKKNLFFSFVIDKNILPLDLPIQSYSIYFSFILKDILKQFGSSIWLKWPNDFYINDKKVGGTLTNLNGNLVYCGIGLNLYFVSKEYGNLDINIDIQDLLKKYFKKIKDNISWKDIFNKYLIEFENSKQYKTTIKNLKISLKDAILNKDGSITIDNEKVFSLR
jgi:BirA family biotin operon repressor/biotin-[acetyl-CoA-carboxylase] ligase